MVVFGYCRYRAIGQRLTIEDMPDGVQNKQISAWLTMTQLILSVLENITGFSVFMKVMLTGMNHRCQLSNQNEQDS
jgi:hypothetical protein